MLRFAASLPSEGDKWTNVGDKMRNGASDFSFNLSLVCIFVILKYDQDTLPSIGGISITKY